MPVSSLYTGERERERKRERERQTDRRTDGRTDRQTEGGIQIKISKTFFFIITL